MKIEAITILTNLDSTDKVIVHTDLPSPFPPSITSQNLSMDFEVTRGHGIEYINNNFPGIPFDTINTKTGERKVVL